MGPGVRLAFAGMTASERIALRATTLGGPAPATGPMNRPPNPLLAPLGRALERALNRGLALDPDTRRALQPLDGRQIVLTLDAPRLALALTVDGERLQVGPADAVADPDLSLAASAGALLAQLLPRRDGAAPVGRLKISGDAELAQRLQKLAAGFEPDFEAAFAGVFGDVVGVQVARALRQGLARGSESARRFARDAADYVSEERGDVATRVEQSVFFDQVDALRDDVDRLAARIARLRDAGTAR
jgi:ubiquinone biosynthesis accessory factor UbiJ